MNSVLPRSLRTTAVRSGLLLQHSTQATAPAPLTVVYRRSASSLPTIAQPSFWKSLVPKPLRRSEKGYATPGAASAKAPKSKEWNPATFYIFIFLFIGSMSIQMIALKKDFDTYMRQSEVKIGLLREVVERIQKGEDVDVERVLGTGDPEREAEWEAVLKEIERDEVSRNSQRPEKKAAEAAPASSSESNKQTAVPDYQDSTGGSSSPVKVASATSFY